MLFLSKRRRGRASATSLSNDGGGSEPPFVDESALTADISPLRATLTLALERAEPNEYEVVLLNSGPATAHEVQFEVVAASGGGEPWRLTIDTRPATLEPGEPLRVPALRSHSSTPGVVCNVTWIDIDGQHDERMHATFCANPSNGTSLRP